MVDFHDELQDGAGTRVVRDFARRLVSEFAKHSRAMWEATGDLPYTYRERQVSASLIMAMAPFVDAVYAEVPTKREGADSKSHGWIDYWVAYRNTTFVVELKHAYKLVNNKPPRKSTLAAWECALSEQLGSLSDDVCRGMHFSSGQVVKCALTVVTQFATAREGRLEPCSAPDQRVIDSHSALVEALGPQANFHALWHVTSKPDMQGPYEFDDQKRHGAGYVELYPAVSLVAHFEVV